MQEKINKWGLMLFLTFISIVSYAQSTLSGNLTMDNKPVADATVTVAGTEFMGTTDAQGHYEILGVPDGTYDIEFSKDTMWSMDTVVIAGGDAILDAIFEKPTVMDEVVVVGYGSKKMKDVTGAVANLKASDANIGGSSTNVDQMLSGRIAGVQFKQNSAQPGGGGQTIIRGRNSIFGATNPLYIVDGVPLSEENSAANGSTLNGGSSFSAPPRNPLNSINPNDIESISVLKDAAATAIYGSRGANGVIIITTKKGKGGKAKFSYDAYFGWQNATETYDLMNSSQYKTYWNKLGKTFNSPQIDTNINTDWQDEILHTGTINSHNVSMSGSTETIKYFTSIGYYKQEGILRNSAMERYNGRLNLGYTKDKLSVNTSLFASFIKDKNQSVQGGTRNSLIASAITFAPYYSPSDDYVSDQGSDFNVYPLSLLNIKDQTKSNKLNSSIDISYELMEGLKPQIRLGYETQNSTNNFFLPNSVPDNGSSSVGVHGGKASNTNANNNNLLFEGLLNYNRTFDKHQIVGLLGYSYQKFNAEQSIAYGERFPVEIVDGNYNLQSASTQLTYSERNTSNLISGFGRIDYTYDGKYSLTASLRRDGSSKFAEGNKWGWFPGVSVAWKISQEDFLNESKFINSLKLRAGYGLVGNQGFASYLSLSRYNIDRNGLLGQKVIGGATLSSVAGNSDLKWETTSQLNIGADFELLKRRIVGNIDFFHKKTKDLIVPINLPFESGYSTKWVNAADTKTNGIEISLNTKNVDTENFSWNSTINFSSLKTTVDKIYGGSSAKSALELLGFKEGEVANAYFAPNFEKLADDGSFVLSKDVVYQGSPDPKWTLGIGNTLKYKAFSLDFFFNGAFGQKLYNYAAAEYGVYKSEQTTNLLASSLDFVSATGNYAKRADNINGVSWGYNSKFIEDAWYINLQNITLAYDMPVEKFFGGNLSALKLYFQLQNVFTITDYSGLDPESSNSVYMEKGQYVPAMLPGKIDMSGYPPARTYSLGLSVSF